MKRVCVFFSKKNKFYVLLKQNKKHIPYDSLHHALILLYDKNAVYE